MQTLNWLRQPRVQRPSTDSAVNSLALSKWVFNPGSLTQAVSHQAQGNIRVEVIRQTIVSPAWTEIAFLKLRFREDILLREVLIYGLDQPWIYAKSYLPVAALKRQGKRLLKCGSQPLGPLLFNNQSRKRRILKVDLSAHPDFPAVEALIPLRQHLLWRRFSMFYTYARPLLMEEVFLPGLFQNS